MSKRKKPKAEKIQLRISQRLKRMEKEGAKPDDLKYLWHWTHELYERAKNYEYLEETLKEIEALIEKAKQETNYGK